MRVAAISQSLSNSSCFPPSPNVHVCELIELRRQNDQTSKATVVCVRLCARDTVVSQSDGSSQREEWDQWVKEWWGSERERLGNRRWKDKMVYWIWSMMTSSKLWGEKKKSFVFLSGTVMQKLRYQLVSSLFCTLKLRKASQCKYFYYIIRNF